ncbi:hypothetical protein [uncultured Aeromicrobium sp.]|uniref:hypothetical protein n=1 Tax=uncultured Aeromicrobium sp. TaxID=337820 RepID=UPI0025F2E454|nr:hypothetical protein [uncultured Aeromicrobium sp.]
MFDHIIIASESDVRDFLVTEGQILGAPVEDFDIDAIVSEVAQSVTYGTTTRGDLEAMDIASIVAKHERA